MIDTPFGRLSEDVVDNIVKALPRIAKQLILLVIDSEIDEEARYEFGTQNATFAKSHGFGEWTWRYTIPGHGVARWSEILKILKDSGYNGVVSVELEDENFNGTEDGEKRALELSLAYLRGV